MKKRYCKAKSVDVDENTIKVRLNREQAIAVREFLLHRKPFHLLPSISDDTVLVFQATSK